MLEHLNEFSQNEMNSFKKFVRSPYFNTSERLIRVFDYLLSIYPAIQKSDVTKAKLFEKVYPSQKYNELNARKLVSDFTLLLESYLKQSLIEKDEVYNSLLLLDYLLKKGVNKRFELLLSRVEKLQKKQFVKGDNFYRNQHYLELTSYFYNIRKLKNKFPESLQNASDSLNLNFVFSKLHIYRDMFWHQYYVNRKLNFNKDFENDIFKFTESNLEAISKKHPNLYIIYLSLLILEKNEPRYLNELKSYLKKHEKKFDAERLNYFYNYLLSYYWMKINEGKTELRKEVLDIYKYMDGKKFLRTEKYIKDFEFNNVIMSALTAGDYDWAEYFINKYRKNLDPEFAKDAWNLSMAKLYFYRKNFSNSLNYLKNVDYKDPNYYINAKNILAKTLFELGDYDSIEYVIDSLRHYSIRNKNLTTQQAQNIRMSVKYFSWMIKIKRDGRKEIRDILFMLEKETRFVPNKDWLYEKIEECSN